MPAARAWLYFGFQWPVRGFHVVDPDGLRGAHEPSRRTGSDLEAIVAAFGPPRAFDLRVFHVDDAGKLELVGRQQFGWVRMLGLLRRPDGSTALVAVRDARGENIDVFPEPPHYGAPPGVYLLRWTGAELTTLVHAPPPHGLPLIIQEHSVIADLDGDARDELAVPLRDPEDRARHMLLVRQTGAGGLESLVVGHCEPLAAVRVAADGAPRLLVVDAETRELWALGVGDLPFPPVPAPSAASVPPPPALTDELLRQRWTRADDLAAAGMPASAAEVLRDGASMVGDEGLRRRFRDRAAALFAVAHQPEAALALDTGRCSPAIHRRRWRSSSGRRPRIPGTPCWRCSSTTRWPGSSSPRSSARRCPASTTPTCCTCCGPDPLAPAVRAAAGTRVLRPLAATWLSLARHHFDDPALQRELLAALDGIETIVADDDLNRRAVGELLYARAKIHLQLGRHARARRDFEGALSAFGATPDSPGEPLRAATHLALVTMLVDDDPGAALGHMARAVACDEAPELTQDRLRREPRVAARAAVDPAWARVLTDAPSPATCSDLK